MLSKEDYMHYLKEMITVEYKMMQAYQDLNDRISDLNLKEVFLQLIKEEKDHGQRVEKLLEFITDNYDKLNK